MDLDAASQPAKPDVGRGDSEYEGKRRLEAQPIAANSTSMTKGDRLNEPNLGWNCPRLAQRALDFEQPT